MTEAAYWARSIWADSSDLLAIVEPGDDNPGAVGQPLHECFAAILAAGDEDRALAFLCHALSRWDCISWSAKCLLALGSANRADPAFAAVLQWLDTPDDGIRRLAGEQVEAAQRDSPATLLAMAVFFSGGSIAPDDLAPVLPPNDVSSNFCLAALMMAAHSGDDPSGAIGLFLRNGLAVVEAA